MRRRHDDTPQVYKVAYTDYRIENLYKGVELVTVDFEVEHNSPLLHATKKGTMRFTPDMRAMFIIDCPNKECTEGGVDIGNEIGDMVRKKETCRQFKMGCGGREAADHPEHRCETTYCFSVSITFSKSS